MYPEGGIREQVYVRAIGGSGPIRSGSVRTGSLIPPGQASAGSSPRMTLASLRVRSTFVPSASPRSGGIARRTIAAKGFHSPSASELLSLAWPRESNQREGHPKAVVSGLLSSDFATGLRGFADSTSVCWQRTGCDPSRPPCGPFLRPAATAYGTLVARILRARAKSNVKSVGRSRSGCESSGAGGKGPEE